MCKDNQAGQTIELRKRAEEIARSKVFRLSESVSPEEIQKIIHELRVHQIELEMQNEELRRTQVELDAARSRYFELYDKAPAGYCTLSELDFIILEANTTIATLLGATRRTLVKQPISRFIFKEDQDVCYLLCKQLFKSGEPQECELRMAKTDGTTFWGHLAAAKAQDPDGNSVCRIVLSDITRRKHAEEALQEENRKQYRNLVEDTADLITRVDVDGRFLFANHAILEICGLTPEACIGRFAFEVIHPEDRDMTAAAFQNWLNSGIEVFKHENRLINTDGRVHYMSWSIRAEHDEDGNISGFASTARDITWRRKTENALRESESFLKETQIIANLGTYTLDITADNWSSSEVLDTIFGIDADFDRSFAGWTSIIHPEWQKIMADYFIKEVAGNKTGFDKEYKIIRQNDQAERWVHGIGKLKFNDKNQPVVMVGTIRDITERKQAEEALKRSEAELSRQNGLFSSLLKNLPVGVFMVEAPSGRPLVANEAALNLLGRGILPDATTQNLAEVYKAYKAGSRIPYPPEEMPVLLGINGKSAHVDDLMVERPDGTEIFLEIFGSPVTDSQGQIWASLVSFIDITERKQTEEILRRSEARFRSYFDLPLEGRAISLPDTCWLDVNTTLCDMFGYTKAELTQMTWAELTHPDDLAANFEQLNRVLAGEIDGYTLDKRFIHKDGHTVFSILTVQCVRNPDRSVDYFMTVIQDISARKQMEDALRESEERFRSLVNLVPIPLMFVNKNSAITYFNNRFGKLFGYISADIPTAGKWFHLAYPDKNYRHYVIETWNKAVAKAAREGTDIEPVEYNVTCKDGTVRVMETSGITIGDDLLVSSIDLTEHKLAAEEIKLKNAELLKINAEKDKFFSIIAHDLRSPFNSFLMLTKIIAEGSSRLTMDEIREIAADMRDSAAGIFRLLENLLEWSITQQGLMPFNPAAVQLRPLVAESMAMAQEPAKSKGIEITYDVPDDMTVFAESNMLQTVIRNLVSNAVKFTSKGGKISLSAKTADDRSIEISVKDSGIGMNKALVDNLFRLDIQTNRKGTASEPGSGLGLLLCKEFVEKHGGRIWVESKEGKGTVFNFTIPYNAEQETKILIPAAKKAGKIKDLKILIAEDDEKSELLITMIVKKFGKEILKARTGTEAVAACRNNPDLDLLLMDIEMPEMDGYKAARQIRQFNQDVVIIAQTAYALVGEREKAIAAGCNDYIAKPFKPSSLTALLEKYF